MSNKRIIQIYIFFPNLLIFSLLLILYKFKILEFEIFFTLIISLCISFVNFLIGFLGIKKGIEKDDKTFFKIVLGTRIIRFFGAFLTLAAVVTFLEIRLNYFIFTFFILYFYHETIEIIYLHKLNSVNILTNNGISRR